MIPGLPTIFSVLALSLCVLHGLAQEQEAHVESAEIRADLSWHPEDLLLGAGTGIKAFDHYRLGVKGFFRPYFAPRVYEEGGVNFQYQEKRWGALLYLERSFSPSFLKAFQATLGLSGGWARELRKGFPESSLDHFLIIPRASIGRNLGERTQLQLEYRYSPQPAINGKEHRLALRTIIDL